MLKSLIVAALCAQPALAASCTKPEKSAMKKAVQNAMTAVTNSTNEVEAIDDLRSDYEMSDADIHAVVEKAAARLKKAPNDKKASELKTVGDIWSLFCS